MTKIQIVALAALLTGCASAPQPQVEADSRYQPVEQTLEHAETVDEQPQLSAGTAVAAAREVKFQAPQRNPRFSPK